MHMLCMAITTNGQGSYYWGHHIHAYSQSDGEGDLLISYTLKTKSIHKYLNVILLNQNIFMEYGIIILKYTVT